MSFREARRRKRFRWALALAATTALMPYAVWSLLVAWFLVSIVLIPFILLGVIWWWLWEEGNRPDGANLRDEKH